MCATAEFYEYILFEINYVSRAWVLKYILQKFSPL